MSPSGGTRRSEAQTFLAEGYWPDVTPAAFGAAASALRDAASILAAGGVPVGITGSLLVPQDEIAMFVVRAASQAVVEELGRRAGITFERIQSVLTSGPIEEERWHA